MRFCSSASCCAGGAGLAGTKVVCGEGDCGACTVLLGRVRGDRIDYAPICACILFAFQLDGCHLITIEGLKDAGRLSPLQQAMVDGHGAQCGFCTPGFVVTLHDLLSRAGEVSPGEVQRGIVGNLCRCTGYDSIIKSATACDRAALKSPGAMYPSLPIVGDLRQSAGDEVLIEAATATGSRKFYKPATLEQAAAFRAANADCTIVAGATDIGVLMSKRLRDYAVLMGVAHLPELGGVATSEDTNGSNSATPALRIGAAATWSEVENATRDLLPEMREYLAWFGSPLIKNGGTVGGNIATGSPIGDSLPPFCVLDAQIELASPTARRRVNINTFYTGYRKNVMAADELIAAIHLPLPAEGEMLRIYKISKRKDMDISSFSAAFFLGRAGDKIANIRIALGGVAATVIRLPAVEEFLRGKAIERDLFRAAGRLAGEAIKPLSDVRGSAEYRRLLAENIFLKFFHDITGKGDGGDRKADANPSSPRDRLAFAPAGGGGNGAEAR